MSLDIHKDIYDQLEHYHKNKRVPNIIFHGQSGCGKKTIVRNFISKIFLHAKER